MSTVVDIRKVTYDPKLTPSMYDIRKVAIILNRQGLIEPLEVLSLDEPVIGSRAWDIERLEAARKLGWSTVIIAIRGS